MQDAVLCLLEKRRVPWHVLARDGSRWWFAVLMLLALLLPSWPTQADVPRLQPANEADTLLQATGVFDRVGAVSVMVEQELANLEASPLFTLEEISQVRTLMSGVRGDVLYQQLQTALSREITPDAWPALQGLEQRTEWRWLAQEEQTLLNPAQQEQLRLYQLRTREMPPAVNRVTWMQALDEARYLTRFEVALRVALRKNLLAAVALIKTRQPLSESALENELREFRDKLSEELAQKAASTYLFVYRKTPTDRVQATVTLFQDPHYRRFMETCEQALQQSFRVVRTQSEESLRIVQINTP